MSSVFNTFPNFIHLLELVKLTCNQNKNKSGMHSQTYSWTKVIPVSRIQTIIHDAEYPFNVNNMSV